MSTARRDQSDSGIRAPETGESVALEKTKSAKDETVSEAETSYRHTVLDDGGGQGVYLAALRKDDKLVLRNQPSEDSARNKNE